MVNKVNVQKAIDIMERVPDGRLDMSTFQSNSLILSQTEADLHACGNTACFAGYIAVSPEFKADGGDIAGCGAPVLPNCDDSVSTIAKWLGVSYDIADALVYDNTEGVPKYLCSQIDSFYGVSYEEVQPHHVIEKLKLILEHSDGE